jgi:hypothetical protein
LRDAHPADEKNQGPFSDDGHIRLIPALAGEVKLDYLRLADLARKVGRLYSSVFSPPFRVARADQIAGSMLSSI